MIQKEIPTKSSCLRVELEAACADLAVSAVAVPIKVAVIACSLVIVQMRAGAAVTLFMLFFQCESKIARKM